MSRFQPRAYDRPLFDPGSCDAIPHRGRRAHRRVAGGATARESPQELVRQFHEVFELPLADSPTLDVPRELFELRHNLLVEEVAELLAACEAMDLRSIADGIADVLYVAYGTAVTYGLDADALVREVHRSNMTKLDQDGQVLRRIDGKILKGPHFEPPSFDL